ncbi:hypothetical protein [Vibrio chemaguriensis]
MLKSKIFGTFSMILPLVLSTGSAYANIRKDIDIIEVGLSKNTGRVFVKSSVQATDTNCSDKTLYAMKSGTPEAYVFYSAALSAMKDRKKMRIQYEPDQCLEQAPKIDVFWNLSY